jgi:hypothetical protein
MLTYCGHPSNVATVNKVSMALGTASKTVVFSYRVTPSAMKKCLRETV